MSFAPVWRKNAKKNAIFKVHKYQASTKFAEETSFKNHLGLEQFFFEHNHSYNFGSLGLGQAPAPPCPAPVGTKANPVSYSIL